MKRLIWTIASAIGLATPAFAYATGAYLTANVDLYAGPDQGYPQIDQLEEGSQVSIEGCTRGWEWCDVVAYGERGWVPGAYLEAQYQNQWVLVPDYAPRVGVPIVVFSISSYWDSYYRNRPFYSQRLTWYRQPLPYRPWPRPINLPPPHPISGPPVHHHPMPMPVPPGHHQPMPMPVPPGHHEPMPMPVPPGHHEPMPMPVPPGHHEPMPMPVPPGHHEPMPMPVPPRVVPMPHPVPDAQSHKEDAPRSDAKDNDPVEQGQHG